MIWEKIRGHSLQIEMFRQALGRGRLSHAYLFVGPPGVGKRLFAQSLAQCLHCERFADTELEACGECPSCRQMLAETHPDLHVAALPEGKTELPLHLFVGEMERRGREGLCYDLSLRPVSSTRKIAIVDDADALNAESANALLKTLEEPPPYSLLILVATSNDSLLPTIRSRCQQIRFSRLSGQDVTALLLELELIGDAREAAVVAELSEGSLAVARQLLDPALRKLRETLYNQLAARPFDGVACAHAMLTGLDELGGAKQSQRETAGLLIQFTAEFYRRALSCLSQNRPDKWIPEVEEFSARLSPAGWHELEMVGEFVDRAIRAEHQLRQNVAVPLCLQALYNDLACLSRQAGSR